MRIVDKAFNGFGCSLGVVFGHNEARDIVIDHLAEPFGIGGDHRTSTGHRLDSNDAEALLTAQRHRHVELGVELWELLVRNVAKEVDKLADAKFITKVYELVAVGAGAGNEQAHVGLRVMPMDEGIGADEGVDAVAVFKGLDVANNKKCRFIGSGDWTKPLHVDTEGSNRYRFGSV